MDFLRGCRGAYHTFQGFARFLTLEEIKNFVGFCGWWLLNK